MPQHGFRRYVRAAESRRPAALLQHLTQRDTRSARRPPNPQAYSDLCWAAVGMCMAWAVHMPSELHQETSRRAHRACEPVWQGWHASTCIGQGRLHDTSCSAAATASAHLGKSEVAQPHTPALVHQNVLGLGIYIHGGPGIRVSGVDVFVRVQRAGARRAYVVQRGRGRCSVRACALLPGGQGRPRVEGAAVCVVPGGGGDPRASAHIPHSVRHTCKVPTAAQALWLPCAIAHYYLLCAHAPVTLRSRYTMCLACRCSSASTTLPT